MKLLEEDVELILSKLSIDTAMPPPITIPITTTVTSTNRIRALRGKTTSNANIFPVKHTTSTNTNVFVKFKFLNRNMNIDVLSKLIASKWSSKTKGRKTSFDKPGGGGAP